jgi:hypothetical protein
MEFFYLCLMNVGLERGCRVWRGPLDGIGEEFDSLLYVFSSFEGDVKG